MRLVVCGPPASGKGSLAHNICKVLKAPHIDAGALLRKEMEQGTKLGRKITPLMEAGQLVPDALVIEVLLKRLKQDDCCNGFVLDGFPRTLPQAQALDAALTGQGQAIDYALALDVPEATLYEWVKGRAEKAKKAGKPPRKDDTPEVFKKRLVQYAQVTAKIFPYYQGQGKLKPVNGHQPIPDVARTALKAIGVPAHALDRLVDRKRGPKPF